jgi:hypothetical protein
MGIVLVLAAGCGGGEISRGSITSCLREADAEVSESQDGGYFHLSASLPDPDWEREGLVASIGDNDVAVLAVTGGGDYTSGSGDDAADVAFSLAEMGFEAQETPSGDVLKQYGNVVVEWSETPTDEQTETLEGCVS